MTLYPGRCVRITLEHKPPSKHEREDELTDESANMTFDQRRGFIVGPCRPYQTVGDTEADPLWRVHVPGLGTDGFWTEELHSAKE